MKAKKIETIYGKYFNTVIYEYRGCKYEVEFARDWTCCCSPAWVQHQNEQAKIDAILDNPKKEDETIIPFDKQIDKIWEMMEW